MASIRADAGKRASRHLAAFVAGLLPLLAPVIAQAGGGELNQSLPADFRPFADTSPWNQPVAPESPTAPGSAATMERLKTIAGALKADYRKWSIPLFVVDARKISPLNSVRLSGDTNPLLDPQNRHVVDGLPLPQGVLPDPSADGHLTIVDPKLMVSWDFARLQGGDGHWQASRVAVWDLRGSGFRKPFAGDNWWTYGARGSGMPLIAGLIRPEEVRHGEIRHALVFASPLTRRSSLPGGPLELCPPASRTDGTVTGLESLPMGVRLQLDPSLDLDHLGLSPEVRTIARAMQRYGMLNGDTTEKEFKIYLQNVEPDGGAWNGMDLSSLARIPITSFRVLECPLSIKVLPSP